MKNWTIKEAVATIKAGVRPDDIKEIARINPLFVLAVAKDDVVAIANMMGEKFTVRRLDDGSVSVADDDADADADEAVAGDVAEDNETAKAVVVDGTVGAPEGDVDYEGMSTKELMKLCDKRGIKVPHYGKNKAFYIDALTNADGTAGTEKGEDETATAEVEEAEAPTPKKAAPKKATKKAPVVEEADEEDEAADDWGDEDDEEEVEEEVPKAKAKKPAAKSNKKPAPKKAAEAEEEDAGEGKDKDEDDDWDL